MMVDKDVIRRVAKNARITLSERELEEFVPQLQEVLKFFEDLSAVNTSNTIPSFQPVLMRNVMREDVVQDSLSQDDALKNTKHKRDGYFKGPKVTV